MQGFRAFCRKPKTFQTDKKVGKWVFAVVSPFGFHHRGFLVFPYLHGISPLSRRFSPAGANTFENAAALPGFSLIFSSRVFRFLCGLVLLFKKRVGSIVDTLALPLSLRDKDSPFRFIKAKHVAV